MQELRPGCRKHSSLYDSFMYCPAYAVSFQKDLLASVGQAVICTDLAGTITYW